MNSGGATSSGAIHVNAATTTGLLPTRPARTCRPNRTQAHTTRPKPTYSSAVASACPCPYRIQDNGDDPSTGSCTRIPPAPNEASSSTRLPTSPSTVVRTGNRDCACAGVDDRSCPAAGVSEPGAESVVVAILVTEVTHRHRIRSVTVHRHPARAPAPTAGSHHHRDFTPISPHPPGCGQGRDPSPRPARRPAPTLREVISVTSDRPPRTGTGPDGSGDSAGHGGSGSARAHRAGSVPRLPGRAG